LQDLGIRIAPKEVAEQFAFEREFKQAFGFHGFFNFAHVLNPDELKKIIELIPADLLGKLDTYHLIDELSLRNQHHLMNLLLKRSSPKGKMWKKHLPRWLRSKFKFLQGEQA
jgi:hypothetical protein